MQIINDVKLDFSDVLIRPKRSKTVSRSRVDLTREYQFLNCDNPSEELPTWEGVPIVAANMDSVGTFRMAESLSKHGMMTCLHKHYSIEQLIAFYSRSDQVCSKLMHSEPPGGPDYEIGPEGVPEEDIEFAKECYRAYVADHTFYTMGIKEDDLMKLKKVIGIQNSELFQIPGAKTKIRHVCMDVANGYQDYFVDCVRRLRDEVGEDVVIMAGNVATPEMVQELLITGAADIVKVGIGPGSVCTTRTTTGVGFPQLSAVIECADAAHGCDGHICADGGCVTPGDVCKAFGAGADFVMLGGMLSGTDECDGEWTYWEDYGSCSGTTESGERKKKAFVFYGMSSKEAQLKHDGEFKRYRAAEGKKTFIPYKGPVDRVIQEVLGGLRSACAYVGTDDLKNLSKCTTFVRVNRTHNRTYGE